VDFLDADYENNYNYDPSTAEPLNLLDCHRLYLDYYFPSRSIDWMKDMIMWMPATEGKPVPVRRGSLTDHEGTTFQADRYAIGILQRRFMRVVARNKCTKNLIPVPLSWQLLVALGWLRQLV